VKRVTERLYDVKISKRGGEFTTNVLHQYPLWVYQILSTSTTDSYSGLQEQDVMTINR
jgi:hypothetical protein